MTTMTAAIRNTMPIPPFRNIPNLTLRVLPLIITPMPAVYRHNDFSYLMTVIFRRYVPKSNALGIQFGIPCPETTGGMFLPRPGRSRLLSIGIHIQLKTLLPDQPQASFYRSRIVQDASVLLNFLQSSTHSQSRSIRTVRRHSFYAVG